MSLGSEGAPGAAVAPAGWYPNPDDASQLRWWTGVEWTTSTRPRQEVPPAPASYRPTGIGGRPNDDFTTGAPRQASAGFRWASRRRSPSGRPLVRVSVTPSRIAPPPGGPVYLPNRGRNSGPIPQIIGGLAVILFAVLYHHHGFPVAARWALVAFGLLFIVGGAWTLARRRRT